LEENNRNEGVARLNSVNIDKNAPDYIVMHFLISDLTQAINEYAEGVLLDIGCGNKPYEPLFFGKISKYIGCDVVQSNLNKVDVVCEATDLKFENTQFNTVFSTQVMEHVEDPQKMIKESYRVLKKEGIAIFSIPFCWELHEEPYDFYRYTKYGLKAMFEREGFQVIKIKPNGGKWAAIFQLNINMVYSTFKKNTLLRRLLKFLFIHLRFTALLNSMAIFFDNRNFDELLTLNYIIIASKNSG
jgi:SAM-dependent methyltransferase